MLVLKWILRILIVGSMLAVILFAIIQDPPTWSGIGAIAFGAILALLLFIPILFAFQFIFNQVGRLLDWLF